MVMGRERGISQITELVIRAVCGRSFQVFTNYASTLEADIHAHLNGFLYALPHDRKEPFK
jgi:hypothetical protein